MVKATVKTSESKEIQKPKEYNPRWKGYVYILFSSLISFASAPSVSEGKKSSLRYAISIGAVTFSISLLVLIFDRFQCFQCFNCTTLLNGKFEGYMLLFCLLWWTAGVAFITRADGPAYRTLNMYFASWMAFASCVYTLNKWSAEKDILSIQELTGLSATLKPWYMLFFSSLVVMGTAANVHPRLTGKKEQNEANFAIILGICSSIIACFTILVHYKFFPKIKQGAMFEPLTALVCLVFWTVGVAILTSDGGIASSIGGQCANCQSPDGENSTSYSYVPGSNLYFFMWSCLLSSLNILVRWKAAQALQFAHATEDRSEPEEQESDSDEAENTDEHDEDAI